MKQNNKHKISFYLFQWQKVPIKGNLTPGFPSRSTAIIPIPENIGGVGTSFRRNDFWDRLVEQAPLVALWRLPWIASTNHDYRLSTQRISDS